MLRQLIEKLGFGNDREIRSDERPQAPSAVLNELLDKAVAPADLRPFPIFPDGVLENDRFREFLTFINPYVKTLVGLEDPALTFYRDWEQAWIHLPVQESDALALGIVKYPDDPFVVAAYETLVSGYLEEIVSRFEETVQTLVEKGEREEEALRTAAEMSAQEMRVLMTFLRLGMQAGGLDKDSPRPVFHGIFHETIAA